jgi:hypothetical protein
VVRTVTARDRRGVPWLDDLLADFADRLLAEWGTVPPAERDVWLRRRLGDLVSSPRTEWRRWAW